MHAVQDQVLAARQHIDAAAGLFLNPDRDDLAQPVQRGQSRAPQRGRVAVDRAAGFDADDADVQFLDLVDQVVRLAHAGFQFGCCRVADAVELTAEHRYVAGEVVDLRDRVLAEPGQFRLVRPVVECREQVVRCGAQVALAEFAEHLLKLRVEAVDDRRTGQIGVRLVDAGFEIVVQRHLRAGDPRAGSVDDAAAPVVGAGFVDQLFADVPWRVRIRDVVAMQLNAGLEDFQTAGGIREGRRERHRVRSEGEARGKRQEESVRRRRRGCRRRWWFRRRRWPAFRRVGR